MTVKALEEFDISRKEAERAKNMFALGLLSWLYNRPPEGTLKFLESKFAGKPEIMKANIAAFQAGWNYGETTEAFSVQYEVKPATVRARHLPQHHRQPALAYGLVAASRRSGLPLFLGSYPITPGLRHPARAVQAQAVRGPHLPGRGRDRAASAPRSAPRSAARSASAPPPGPGMTLKAETIGLAVSVELPLIICDIQRAGPSTGMPTKTEQADLLMALFGRNGESPVAGARPRHARRTASTPRSRRSGSRPSTGPR